MDSQQYEALLRMFHARRLNPCEPEHAKFIEGKIRELEVLEPNDAKGFKEFYDKRLKDHFDAVEKEKIAAEEMEKAKRREAAAAFAAMLPPVQVVEPELPPDGEEPKVEESPVLPADPPKKKRGRKPKVL